MTNILLFRLYAPLVSFGSLAVGEQRPSQTHPGKSLIVGLLAAALGVRRDEELRLLDLMSAYGLAVLQIDPGELLRDYHTAQVPGQSELKKAPHHSRRDELRAAPRADLHTILSTRDYRSEALHVVAIWRRSGTPFAPSLETLRGALEQPQFTLYLGRKSCPLALPLAPLLVEAADLAAAFRAEQERFAADWQVVRSQPGQDRRLLTARLGVGRLLGAPPVSMFWEDGDALDPLPGAISTATQKTHTRYDHSLSRRRWQFGPRLEQGAAWPQPESAR